MNSTKGREVQALIYCRASGSKYKSKCFKHIKYNTLAQLNFDLKVHNLNNSNAEEALYCSLSSG